MDAATAGILTGAAGQLIADGVGHAIRLLGTPPSVIEPVDISFPIFNDEDSEILATLSSTQLLAINRFLQDPRAKILIESRALAQFILDERLTFSTVCDAIRTEFQRLAENGLSEVPDPSIVDLIWTKVERSIEQTYVDNEFVEFLHADERAALATAQVPLGADRQAESKVPAWLRDLVSIAQDLERLLAIDVRVADLRRCGLQEYSELRLDHALEDVHRPLSDLYIHRSIRNSDGDLESTEAVFSDTYRVRVVVTGPPGGGKTTLTQHLLYSLNGFANGRTAAVRVLVREIDLDERLLIKSIRHSICEEYQISSLGDENVSDMLVTGRLFVIFDGLDEIQDVGRRKKMIRKIESFSRRYPMSSMVVTSRNVGYDQAKMTSGLFDRFLLEPFDDEQVSGYAHKWFNGKDGRETAEAFLRDVEGVPDLRENPLMLSLLCTLYKARGHIPRNRRHVYTTCADLLFNRWDSMRQIDQPVDHVEHGQDLMQDIALLFFKSPSAQRGIEERQLQLIIANFLRDSAGVLQSHAMSRAKAFLDFCAGRAWLLGRAGTSSSGERLFVFTHRTFMEFFAAEGLVRGSTSVDELAKTVCDSYSGNASSVLPELVIAAAEASRRGSAREILKGIKSKEILIGGRGKGRYLPLRLRIASVLPLQPRIMDEIIYDAFRKIAADVTGSNAELVRALVSLPRDPAARVRAFLLDPSELEVSGGTFEWSVEALTDAQVAFARNWIVIDHPTEDPLVAAEWSGVVVAILGNLDREEVLRDAVLRNYGANVQRKVWAVPDGDLAWFVEVASGLRAAGVLASSLVRCMQGVAVDEVDMRSELELQERRPAELTEPQGADLAQLVFQVLLAARGEDRAPIEDASSRPLLLAGAFNYWESFGPDARFLETLSSRIGLDLPLLGRTHEAGVLARVQHRRSPTLGSNVRDQLEGLPRWVEEWAIGRFSMIPSAVLDSKSSLYW